MAQFKSFEKLGREFSAAGYNIRKGLEDTSTTRGALRNVGRRFRDYFREKFDEGGPGWAALAEATEVDRARWGFNTDKIMDASSQLKKSIIYQLRKSGVEVGVENKLHTHPSSFKYGTNSRNIMMEDLVYAMEVGSSNRPARPIFTDSDFEQAQLKISYQFQEEMIMTGFIEGKEFKAYKSRHGV